MISGHPMFLTNMGLLLIIPLSRLITGHPRFPHPKLGIASNHPPRADALRQSQVSSIAKLPSNRQEQRPFSSM